MCTNTINTFVEQKFTIYRRIVFPRVSPYEFTIMILQSHSLNFEQLEFELWPFFCWSSRLVFENLFTLLVWTLKDSIENHNFNCNEAHSTHNIVIEWSQIDWMITKYNWISWIGHFSMQSNVYSSNRYSRSLRLHHIWTRQASWNTKIRSIVFN